MRAWHGKPPLHGRICHVMHARPRAAAPNDAGDMINAPLDGSASYRGMLNTAHVANVPQ